MAFLWWVTRVASRTCGRRRGVPIRVPTPRRDLEHGQLRPFPSPISDPLPLVIAPSDGLSHTETHSRPSARAGHFGLSSKNVLRKPREVAGYLHAQTNPSFCLSVPNLHCVVKRQQVDLTHGPESRSPQSPPPAGSKGPSPRAQKGCGGPDAGAGGTAGGGTGGWSPGAALTSESMRSRELMLAYCRRKRASAPPQSPRGHHRPPRCPLTGPSSKLRTPCPPRAPLHHGLMPPQPCSLCERLAVPGPRPGSQRPCSCHTRLTEGQRGQVLAGTWDLPHVTHPQGAGLGFGPGIAGRALRLQPL